MKPPFDLVLKALPPRKTTFGDHVFSFRPRGWKDGKSFSLASYVVDISYDDIAPYRMLDELSVDILLYDFDRTGNWHEGDSYEFDVKLADSKKAKEVASWLGKIERGLSRIYERRGNPCSHGSWLWRVCEILNMKGVVSDVSDVEMLLVDSDAASWVDAQKVKLLKSLS